MAKKNKQSKNMTEEEEKKRRERHEAEERARAHRQHLARRAKRKANLVYPHRAGRNNEDCPLQPGDSPTHQAIHSDARERARASVEARAVERRRRRERREAWVNFIRNNEAFQLMRQVVQRRRDLLWPMLRHIGLGNTVIGGIYRLYPAEFVRLLTAEEV